MSENNERVTEPKANGKNLEQAAAHPPLDPSRPAYHLVPAPVVADVLKILQKLPYEDVYRVVPQLAASPVTQPEAEETK